MQKTLTLEYLKDYIPKKNENILKYRPQCLYIPRPPARRKYETAIRAPDRNFFDLMVQRGVYLWIVAKKNLQKSMYDKIYESYKSVKSLKGYERLPICKTYEQCRYWVSLCPCQIVLFEDIFDQSFQQLNGNQNASGFHIISSDNVAIAKLARENRKIRNIYDDENYILSIVKQNMERLAITEDQKTMESTTVAGQEFRRLLIRNVIFPNFIKLSKHDKSQHNQYRLHLIGLRKLTNDDRLASKDKFVDFSKEKFPNDIELIQQYASNSFENPKEILRFYTLDSFFYRVLNNTLRIAKTTEEFFSVGEPFNKVFDAIKKEYDKSKKMDELLVYRGADLTPSECQYLEENVGKFIEINGFISTSKSLETAKNFARQRKNNTIFKIKFSKIPQKFKQYDYGYVDLQLNKCSAFDQDEVLINALNVFKIAGKEKLQNFDFYILEYGAIFDILQQDPSKLSENDKFSYYSFKQLKQMNEEVKDIGEVYMRTYQPQKAIEIYEFKLQKMKESLDPVKREDIQDIIIKAADAYLANGQPDKALKYYQSTFVSRKKKKLQKRKSLNQEIYTKKSQAELIQLSTKVASIQTSTDRFQQAEQNYNETSKEIQKQMKDKWTVDILWSKVELQWQQVEGKKTQMLFQEQYLMLKEIETTLIDALAKLKTKNQPYEQKKVRLKLTQVYETMAQTTQQSQTQRSRISQISSSFSSVYSELSSTLQKGSYDEGLVNIRKGQILRRTKDFDEQSELSNYKQAISQIQKNSQQTDSILPKVYNNLADLQVKLQKKIEMSQAIGTYKKQLKIETIIYSDNDPKPLNTKMNIAICERDDKNTQVALESFSQAFNTKLFKTETKYTTHAKILFNMSQAYIDKGEDGLALKSLKEGYSILEKQLSRNDFEKSVLRFKIKLRMGRIYMSSSLRTPETLDQAEKNLLQYHKFITNFYKYKHSDVALSHNCLGALYSTVKKFIESKQNFKISIEIYSDTLGTQSMEVAKITANLAICYAQLKQLPKATQYLLQSREIYDKIYSDLRKGNPFEYESKFIQAEIESLSGEYEKAIESCELSKEAERIFLDSKKKNNSNTYIYSEFIGKNNESFNTKFQTTRPQFNSLVNPNLNSIVNYSTEHGFKCDFKICECLIYLKKYKEVKVKLQKLRDQLIDRIQKERINPLFKDTVHSKKQLYLRKSEEYLKKVCKAIQKKQKHQRETMFQSMQSPIKKGDDSVQHL